jgi:hypothetical protein
MMDIADKCGLQLTMFLDYCEEHLYGEALLDVGREIHYRGHDLQLHAHIDFMKRDFWATHGIPSESSLNELRGAKPKPPLLFCVTAIGMFLDVKHWHFVVVAIAVTVRYWRRWSGMVWFSIRASTCLVPRGHFNLNLQSNSLGHQAA